MDHPFLDSQFHVRWSTLTPDRIEADITKALADAQSRIDAVAAQDPAKATFESALLGLERATEDLGKAWGKVGHLDSVCNNPALRAAHNAMIPKVSDFYTRISLNEKLWAVLKAYAQSAEAQNLSGARKRFLEETLADFRESGADLPPDKKKRLEAINAELSQVTQKFSENVLDSMNGWEMVLDDERDLSGLPQLARESARQSARQKGLDAPGQPRWRFTLQGPSYTAFMTYADSDTLRRRAYEGSDSVGRKDPHDNTDLLWKALALRHEKAQLLGFNGFADLILKRRMAGSGARARAFVQDLHDRVRPAFQRELQELEEYTALKKGVAAGPLEPWETAYWAEKRRKELFDFDEEALRPYFPINGVIGGLFRLAENLFGVTIRERPTYYLEPGSTPATQPAAGAVEVWHPEVKFYELHDHDGRHLGSFYADWHPRESKRGGAWMNHLSTGGPLPDGSFEPHLGLICGNLTPEVEGKPALLTHDEVLTVFHEFGHLLHHLFGEVPIKSLNGVNVVWDFVELPSQILENWCWEPEGLSLFARHYETGEPIPEDLVRRMLAARNYMEAWQIMRQLSFARMDLDLHIDFAGKPPVADLECVLRERLSDYLPRLKTQKFSIAWRFNHIFGSPTGYAAGYYSYKWAEVLDADAFTRFQKEGVTNARTGHDFRQKILSRGNSEPPENLFRDFMGRDPDLTALLVRSGLVPA